MIALESARRHPGKVAALVLLEPAVFSLDLSQAPLELSETELHGMRQPTLIISAQHSPEALHAINRRLAGLLPDAETALVPGGHLIDPAGPAVLDFLHRRLPAAGISP